MISVIGGKFLSTNSQTLNVPYDAACLSEAASYPEVLQVG